MSELARRLRLARQAVQMTVRKFYAGDLVELLYEPGRVYVRPSATAMKRLHLFREFTRDFKAGVEAELTGDERYRLTKLLERAESALEAPRQPEWWLAP